MKRHENLENKARLAVRIDENIHKELKRLALEKDESLSFLVDRVLRDYVETQRQKQTLSK